MSYTSDIKAYLKQIKPKNDVLPKSEVERYGYNRVGLYLLSRESVTKFKSDFYDFSSIYVHEKGTPDKFGVRSKSVSDELYPSYFKFYNSVRSAVGKTIANSAMNIFPTPLQAYGIAYDSPLGSSVGMATIDLNSLNDAQTNEHVDSIRLDYLLHSLGLAEDFKSYYTFQEILKSGKLNQKLTARAIVQLGLSKIFIPNAIGENDPNSRNIILLKDKNTDKYDVVVRMDIDEIDFLLGGERESDKLEVATGIFDSYETLDEHLKIIKSKDLRIDWELFSGFMEITNALCSRSNIDDAITKAFVSNSFRFDPNSYLSVSPYVSSYDASAFAKFSEYAIARSSHYISEVFNAFSGIKRVMPFAEKSKMYGDILVEDTPTKQFIQRKYDDLGHEL